MIPVRYGVEYAPAKSGTLPLCFHADTGGGIARIVSLVITLFFDLGLLSNRLVGPIRRWPSDQRFGDDYATPFKPAPGTCPMSAVSGSVGTSATGSATGAAGDLAL